MKDKVLWWQQAAFYQIYMPAFVQESISTFSFLEKKIPYYQGLGIKGLWLTPFYPSPKVDNGYDVADYENIAPEYGTFEEFEAFLASAHRADIRVIADMVLNHTSDRHAWFEDSLAGKNGREDWYIWSEHVPNNWESFFGGSAWEWKEERKAYYYHSFAKEQADLNFHNQDVIDAVADVLEFWQNRGVDGFRLDVINNLSTGALYIDNPYNEKGEQLHIHDVNQAGVEEMLIAIRRKTEIVSGGRVFLVGEISSEELPLIHHYAGDGMLHTTFNFNLGSRETFCITDFYEEIKAMQQLYMNELPTLFFGSHDMRRFASRFGMDAAQIKTLCVFQMTFRGIPFLYYGEEIGMQDIVYRNISDVKDCQALLAYEEAKKQGGSEAEAMEAMYAKSRDYSRGTMDWEEAERQQRENISLLSFYRNMLAFRNGEAALQRGECSVPEMKDNVISYDRIYESKHFRILLNFTAEEHGLDVWRLKKNTPVLDSGGEYSDCILKPFSGAVYQVL